jgi:hypothetical protein
MQLVQIHVQGMVIVVIRIFAIVIVDGKRVIVHSVHVHMDMHLRQHHKVI